MIDYDLVFLGLMGALPVVDESTAGFVCFEEM